MIIFQVQTVNEMITRKSRSLLPQTMTELRQIIFDEVSWKMKY